MQNCSISDPGVCPNSSARLLIHARTSAPVVLLALLLWLAWPCAAPPAPLLGVLRPIPFEVGVICASFLLFVQTNACMHACRADAVVLVLYEVQQTWAGSLHRKKDTCVVKALAITAVGKMQPVLWSSHRLPSDCFSVTAVPNGGALILSPALVIYQNKVPAQWFRTDREITNIWD